MPDLAAIVQSLQQDYTDRPIEITTESKEQNTKDKKVEEK